MNAASLSMYTAFGVLAAGTLPVTVAARGLEGGDVTHRRAGRSLRTLARAITAVTGAWDFSVEGAAPPDLDRRPVVVVANHRSMADPFLLSHLPFDMRFVAKAELFGTPLVGWLLRLGGDIPVRRGDAASAAAMARACVNTLRGGLSVMIFPEGTRSRDGQLGRLRDGAFRVAIEAGARVLPVALHGTGRCVVAGGLQRAVACAEILPALDSAGAGVAELRDRTAAALAGALDARPQASRIEQYFLGCPVDVGP